MQACCSSALTLLVHRYNVFCPILLDLVCTLRTCSARAVFDSYVRNPRFGMSLPRFILSRGIVFYARPGLFLLFCVCFCSCVFGMYLPHYTAVYLYSFLVLFLRIFFAVFWQMCIWYFCTSLHVGMLVPI
jgi:hypothetical protein